MPMPSISLEIVSWAPSNICFYLAQQAPHIILSWQIWWLFPLVIIMTVEWFVFVELTDWTIQENPHTAGTCHQTVSRKGICMALHVRKAYIPPCPLLNYCSEQIPCMAGAVPGCLQPMWSDIFWIAKPM
jgi:hypothetical protein